MTRVKICGITNLRDALAAAGDGADALGFNFWPGSPRCIQPGDARKIIGRLPPLVTPVGLFVNDPPEKVRRVAGQAGLRVVQLHGEESPATVRKLAAAGLTVIKVVGVGAGFQVKQLADYPAAALFLLDTQDERLRGGTGKTFNWARARAARRYGKILLAGGLTPANVARAVKAARPFGVDVSSGVERRPGIKDHKKVREFVRRAKGVKL